MTPIVTTATPSENPQQYEDIHVHSVYEQIAPHFSSTRYKPWPIISAFLSSLPSGWVGLDSGTGNGKYLPLPLEISSRIWTIGLDKSLELLKIARYAGGTHREVVHANVLDNPWRKGIFDYAISIATIHHLATYERRKQAVKRLLQAVSPSHGRVMIYVWAVEQDELSKRDMPTPTQGQSSGKDVFVPWVLSSAQVDAQAPVFNRYYHMFAKGELRKLVEDAAEELGLLVGSKRYPSNSGSGMERGIEFTQDGWERSNYFVELRCWS